MGDLAKVNGFWPEQIHLCRTVAKKWYESNGWQSYPSRHDAKRPLLPSFAEWWEGGAPSVDELWTKYPSGNVQVVTGRAFDLCALDLDGPEGIKAFYDMCAARGQKIPWTWTVSNDRRNGIHIWFRLPKSAHRGPSIGRRLLWGVWDDEGGKDGKGGWKKRAAIELLCDRCLIMAPPSLHPNHHNRRYQFHAGTTPKQVARPAIMPEWILDLPPLGVQKKVVSTVPADRPAKFIPVTATVDEWGKMELPARPNDIRDAIYDKVALVQRWGLRIASFKPNASGWIECHDIDRPDNDPSAMFNPATGRFWRPLVNDGRSVCIFRLAVELGVYVGWREAAIDLYRQYLSPGGTMVPKKIRKSPGN